MSTSLATRLSEALAGQYRIERLLGQGGMASVFLATRETDGRAVAVKVLRQDVAMAVGAERFLREIEVERQLDHPGIIPVLDSGDAGGIPYYVMPLVDGESLRDRLDREKQIPLDETLRITRAAADALAHAHVRGIVHRDVKPDNILLAADGTVVLADFGIARAVVSAGGERLTQTGMIVGTPSYLAPELAIGLDAPTPAADQYGLACVVLEMLSGAEPFKGPTAVAIMARHAMDTPPSLKIICPGLPPYVEAAIHRGLAKKPEKRFAGVAEFADALEGKAPAEPEPTPAATNASATAAKGAGCASMLLLGASVGGLAVICLRLLP
jgi:serine/threonine-protein kinase